LGYGAAHMSFGSLLLEDPSLWQIIAAGLHRPAFLVIFEAAARAVIRKPAGPPRNSQASDIFFLRKT